jgi:hypothetical protein
MSNLSCLISSISKWISVNDQLTQVRIPIKIGIRNYGISQGGVLDVVFVVPGLKPQHPKPLLDVEEMNWIGYS